jgi:hypothetical protein
LTVPSLAEPPKDRRGTPELMEEKQLQYFGNPEKRDISTLFYVERVSTISIEE